MTRVKKMHHFRIQFIRFCACQKPGFSQCSARVTLLTRKAAAMLSRAGDSLTYTCIILCSIPCIREVGGYRWICAFSMRHDLLSKHRNFPGWRHTTATRTWAIDKLRWSVCVSVNLFNGGWTVCAKQADFSPRCLQKAVSSQYCH